jgi:hypothetical protein
MQTAAASSWSTIAIYLGVALVAAVALVLFWIWHKGRPLPGDHVFRASRMSRDNHLFPAQVVISPSSITCYRPQWIGKSEESIHMAHVASIKIDTHMVFSDVTIETSGGQDPILCHGHTKSDAVAMKSLIEDCQTAYYRTQKDVTRPESSKGRDPSRT